MAGVYLAYRGVMAAWRGVKQLAAVAVAARESNVVTSGAAGDRKCGGGKRAAWLMAKA